MLLASLSKPIPYKSRVAKQQGRDRGGGGGGGGGGVNFFTKIEEGCVKWDKN
jgi:hypothetical protein